MTTKTTTAAHRRRGIRSRQRRLADIDIELATLRAAEEDEREDQRRSDDTDRKRLAGVAVLKRVIQRAGRIRWLRKQLDSGLTRAADRDMFRLEDDGPLIPRKTGRAGQTCGLPRRKLWRPEAAPPLRGDGGSPISTG